MLLLVLRLPARHGIRHHDLLLGQIGHPELLTPPLLTQIIVRRVRRQPVQPRLKNLRRPELIERKIQPHEYFLRDVLDIFRPGDQLTDLPQNPLPVCQYDFVERHGIAVWARLISSKSTSMPHRYVPASGCFSRFTRKGAAGPWAGYNSLRAKGKTGGASKFNWHRLLSPKEPRLYGSAEPRRHLPKVHAYPLLSPDVFGNAHFLQFFARFPGFRLRVGASFLLRLPC